jgi:large subunit ribosomal protein L10
VNRDQKAAVIDRVATEIEEAGAIFAVDYRGISVKQAVDLRAALREAEANFQVVKNTLTERAADKAGAEHLKPFLEGPTALTFVKGDVALAAKAVARFKRESGLLEWKGGEMDGNPLSPEELDALARLPAREQLHAQLVGTIASPLTTLVRGLAGLISGLGSQLQQIADQGLVQGAAPAEGSEEQGARSEEPEGAAAPDESGEAETAAAEEPQATPEEAPAEEAPAEEAPAEEDAEEAPAAEASEEAPAESDAEAPGDPVAEGEAAAADETSESETETEEG